MISKDFKTISNKESCSINKLDGYTTKDGSISLFSRFYNESFHSACGALKESEEKFILPSQLESFSGINKINLLDVCFGLGYNTGCFLEKTLKLKTKISSRIWGLEIDKRPLKFGLHNPKFRKNWSPDVLNCLESLHTSGIWDKEDNHIQILWGDARQRLSEIPKELKFDLIFLDAFSPTKCPQLWSEEFLFQLSKKLSEKGRLITYSSAAAIRGSLKRAGLKLQSLIPEKKGPDQWSAGTIASKQILDNKTSINANKWKELSPMEEEHLSTRAAIPYRDPTGISDANEILIRRYKEQQNCELTSTKVWRKRWKQPN